MDERAKGRVYDVCHEMRGLASVLDAAAHGDMAEPELIVGYESEQISRLSDMLAVAIVGSRQD